jgi:DNA-directed RNA polymerase specialized sigma24 family protein
MAHAGDAAPKEDALLLAARKGDRAALGDLLERQQQRVFAFGMKMCGDVEDAKEVVQDTLLSMVRSVRDFRGEASLSTWLYTVTRSFCIKKRRRSKGHPRSTSRSMLPRGSRLLRRPPARSKRCSAARRATLWPPLWTSLNPRRAKW